MMTTVGWLFVIALMRSDSQTLLDSQFNSLMSLYDTFRSEPNTNKLDLSSHLLIT